MAQDDKKNMIIIWKYKKIEIYIIWLSFMVHFCKMMMSQNFSFFQNFNSLDC